jgi:hypothetical protein
MEEMKCATTDELEAARLEVLRLGGPYKDKSMKFAWLTFLGFVCLVIAFFYFLSINEGNNNHWIPAFIVFGVIIAVMSVFVRHFAKHHNEYIKYLTPFNETYKAQLLPIIMDESFDKVYAFESKNGLAKEIIVESGIFPDFKYITTNDYLRAKYGEIKFEFCDVLLEREKSARDVDGRPFSDDVTAFEGLLIVMEFDHFVDTPTFIISGEGQGNVTTESILFNRQFSVKCENTVDALRILTPMMMEEIIKLKEFCKRKINLSFSDDKIYFCLDDRHNRFEIAGSVEKPIAESRVKIDADIKYIKELLDHLDMRNLKSKLSQKKTEDKDYKGRSVHQDNEKLT